MSTDQFHFQFNEWKEAFATYYRKHCGERLYDDAIAKPEETGLTIIGTCA